MLNRIITFSVRNKLLIGLATIFLIIFGAIELSRLPIDAVPDITDNQVQVITIAPSFGASDIERLITFPIEQANSNIPGLKEIRSFSRFGLSVVTIVFDDNTDLYWARQQVSERLQLVQKEIPEGMGTPELGPVTTGLGEIYQYVLKPKKGYEHLYDEYELRTLQDWLVRRQLLGVEGVAEVSSFGGKLKQYEIALNSSKLQAFGITLQSVFEAVQQSNQNTGGAYIEKGGAALFIRTEGLISSLEDMENISLGIREGAPLLLRDVAEIRYGHATRYGALCYNETGEVAGAIVMMLKDANSNDVIHRVKERIEQIRTNLPEGVEIEPFLDRTKMVNNAIGTVQTNLLEGALIVVFILVLFLGSWRAGLLVASVIPLSMLFAVILMNAFGVSGNLMSLGAIDFGLIVDGAVIIVEAVLHLLRDEARLKPLQLSADGMNGRVEKAAGKMMNSAVFGQIIILVVYLPILTLQGIEGKMFKPMAQTVGFALLGAFILSLTYVPMMSSWILRRKVKGETNRTDRIMDRMTQFYGRLLEKTLSRKKAIILGSFGAFALSIILLLRLGGEFIPALEEGDFAVEVRFLAGSNLQTSVDASRKCANILKNQFPEVIKVVTKIGSGEVPTDPMPMEACDMMIILKDKDQWTSASTFDELAEKMTVALDDVPGITTSFQYPVQMRFNELMTGARQDVVCKIFGENLDTLAHYSKKLGVISSEVKGTSGLYVETVGGLPQIVIDYKRNLLAQYGLHIEEINSLVNTAFAGKQAGVVYEGEKRFDLILRLDSKNREDLEDVRNLLVPVNDHDRIPLSQLADVNIEVGPNQIQREDAKRRIIVGFNVRGRDVQSVVQDLQQRVKRRLHLPPGYYVTYGGTFENLAEAKNRLMIAVPVSLGLILLLLYLAFGSLRHGLLIYSAIPLSAIGGIVSLYLRDMPFSISAGVGFIALFGISVLNGIVLLAEFNHLQKQGLTDLKQIVKQGTANRLRPVLMTALVASLGFLPMAVSNGAGAEVQRPLATVVIGGLLVATLLTLFVLPQLYLITEQRKRLKMKPEVFVLLILFMPAAYQAQSSLHLDAALDSAYANNQQLHWYQLETEKSEMLAKGYRSLPPFQIQAEAGQINSIFMDHRLGVQQSFHFPGVNQKQRMVLKAGVAVAISEKDLAWCELKRQIRYSAYRMMYLNEKEKLLLKSDSLLRVNLERIQNQVKKGQSDLLELSVATSHQVNIHYQLLEVIQERDAMKMRFNLLINAQKEYVPHSGDWTQREAIGLKALDLASHPQMSRLDHQQRATEEQLKLEKSSLLPDLGIAYNNMTMKGSGADNQTYGYDQRFQSIQFSLALPVFSGRTARVNALKMELEKSNLEMETLERQLILTSKQLSDFHLQQLSLLKEWDEKWQADTHALVEVANRRLEAGEASFSQWAIWLVQAQQNQINYLDAVYKLHENKIELLYINGQ